MVAIMDGTPTFTTISPFTMPAIIPTRSASTSAISAFPVERNREEKVNPEIAMTDGNDRSMSPEMITRVRPSAMIAAKGIVDMKDMYILLERNVEGLKIMKMMSSAIRTKKIPNCNMYR
jgi:hypothetical protein